MEKQVVYFRCRHEDCRKQWAITNPDDKHDYYCPHCGARQSFRNAVVAEPADALVSEASSHYESGGSNPLDRTDNFTRVLMLLEQARAALREWIDEQGHERCWYYPEIFRKLCGILDVTMTKPMNLPPRPEFGEGCDRYEREVYEQGDLLPPVSHDEKA